MSITSAVILAAGEGKRMRPLTANRPKVMLPLANKPILEHLLMEMRKSGIKEFIFIVGYHDEHIRAWFGDGQKWGARISYITQREQLGTADALRQASTVMRDNFIVANGDVLVSFEDISAIASQDSCMMCLIERGNTEGLGTAEVKNGRVSRIHEKSANPPTRLVNTGLYAFTQDIFQAIAQTQRSFRGEFELTDSIQIMIDSGRKVGYSMVKRWLDVSYPWDMLPANERLMTDQLSYYQGRLEPNVFLKNECSIGKGTMLRSGTYIEGPVIIGENGEIGPNCYVRPFTAIGSNCRIGAGVEIKNSIIMSNTKIPHLSYIGDSVIGENCNIGAGTKTANLRFDKQPIMSGGLNSGREKLGAIIGDNVQTGINSTIDAGTMIGENSMIGPGASVRGVIESGTRVF